MQYNRTSWISWLFGNAAFSCMVAIDFGHMLKYSYSLRREEMKYRIALKRTEEGYSVWCPGLPGCWSQAKTEEAAIENIREAIGDYLAAVKDSLRDVDVREVEVTV